jgi:peptidoglycan/LPS O-acetylase OafA/YrhL
MAMLSVDASGTAPAAHTIGARLGSRTNNFDALRLVAAFLVIFSHSYPIRDGTRDAEPYWRLSGYCSFGEIAVAVFFVISGMLVARSYLADPDAKSYLRKRLLRIMPGLVACVAACVLVIGPIFTELRLGEYFTHRVTWGFARNAILVPNRFDLPGVFGSDGTIASAWDPQNATNGSLWSLPLEFIMYLGVLGLGVSGLLRRKSCLLLVASAMLFEWLIVERIGFEPGTCLAKYRVWFESLPQLGFLFFGGTLMLLFKDSIVLDWRWFIACLVIIAIGWQAPFEWVMRGIGHPELIGKGPRTPHGYFLLSLCLPYVVMYLAFMPVGFLRPLVQSLTKWGDFSYGVYLYGYPVQQMLMRVSGGKLPLPAFIGLSCLGALVLAALSWHLVEKPFLKMKKRSTREAPVSGEAKAAVDEAFTARPQPVLMQRQVSMMRQVIFFV